jgi:DNA-binding transcriptional LysR family regulator
LASGVLAELLAIYRSRFPAIELNLEEATSQVSASAILSGRLDAAFVPGDPKLPGIRSVRIGGEKIFVAVSCNHEVAEQAAVTWDDLGHETFLVMADVAGPEIEAYLVRQLSRSGFHPRISIQRVGRENLLNMVAHTFGITLTTSSTLGIPYPGIRFVPIVSSEDTISSSIIWSQTNQNPALERLVELSIQLADKMSREAQAQQKARTATHQDLRCRTDDGVP